MADDAAVYEAHIEETLNATFNVVIAIYRVNPSTSDFKFDPAIDALNGGILFLPVGAAGAKESPGAGIGKNSTFGSGLTGGFMSGFLD